MDVISLWKADKTDIQNQSLLNRHAYLKLLSVRAQSRTIDGTQIGRITQITHRI